MEALRAQSGAGGKWEGKRRIQEGFLPRIKGLGPRRRVRVRMEGRGLRVAGIVQPSPLLTSPDRWAVGPGQFGRLVGEWN